MNTIRAAAEGATLASCPFCGSEAVLDTYDSGFIVGCSRGRQTDGDNCPLYPSFTWCETAAEAVAAWNRRAPDPSSAAMRAALEEIARQELSTELDAELLLPNCDFESGYDLCISVARAALKDTP